MPTPLRLRRSSALPGLGLSLGITVFWLSFIVLLPLTAVFVKSASGGWEEFTEAAFSSRAVASYKVTFGAALIAAAVNVVFGLRSPGCSSDTNSRLGG